MFLFVDRADGSCSKVITRGGVQTYIGKVKVELNLSARILMMAFRLE